MSGKSNKEQFFNYVFPEMEKCGYKLKKGNRPCDFRITPPESFIAKLGGKTGRGFTHFDSVKQILTHLENNKPSSEDFKKSLEEFYQKTQGSVPTTPAKSTRTKSTPLSNLEEKKIDSKSTTQTSSTKTLRRTRRGTTATPTPEKDTLKSTKDKSSSASKSGTKKLNKPKGNNEKASPVRSESVIKGSKSCKIFFDEEVLPILEKHEWKMKRGARKSDFRITPPESEVAKLGGKTGRGFTHFDSMKQILTHFESHKPSDKELETVFKEFREIMMNSNRSVTPTKLKKKKGSTPNSREKKEIKSSPKSKKKPVAKQKNGTSTEEETAKKTNPTTKKRKDIESPKMSKNTILQTNIYVREKDIFANILWPSMESEGWEFKPGKGEYGITFIPPDGESDSMGLGKIKSNKQLFDYFKKNPPSETLRKTLRSFKKALKHAGSQPSKKRLRRSKESCSNEEESENDEGSKYGNNMDGLSDNDSDSDESDAYPDPPRKNNGELVNTRFMDMVWPALTKLGWFLKSGLGAEIRYFAPCSSSKCDENSAVKGTDYFESSEELLQYLENNIDKYDQSVEKAINHYKSKFFYSDVIEMYVE